MGWRNRTLLLYKVLAFLVLGMALRGFTIIHLSSDGLEDVAASSIRAELSEFVHQLCKL